MSASVELRAASKRFGAVRAVDAVSLTVRAGEFLTLLGPSGCGKTTLLRLIAGFESPDAGTVWLGGVDVTRVPPYRRDVNQVFQSYALFPHLSVRDNIAFGLRMQRLEAAAIAARVAEAVRLVSLEGCEDRRPHELSGGQRQRVALARALAPRPAVLLLDEPLSALDARLRRTMQSELKRLQRQLGTTFVFVTHDQEEALTLSDRIAVIHDGRVEQCGTGPELYHRPASAFVAEFIGHANVLQVELLAAEAGAVRLRLDAGVVLALPAGAGPAPAGRGRVSIRPEQIELVRAPRADANAFAVRVAEATFKGAMHQLVVVTAAGTRLHVVRAGTGTGRGEFQVGDRGWAVVHGGDVVILPS
jgi:spermidine/putrescine transport system ATP-binding protein